MFAYDLSHFLQTEGHLYLTTSLPAKPCKICITAAKPRRASRSFFLNVEPENATLLYLDQNGGILWQKAPPMSRDAGGTVRISITRALHEANVAFSLREEVVLPNSKPRRLSLPLTCFNGGCWLEWLSARHYQLQGAALSFFPESLSIGQTDIRQICISGDQQTMDRLQEKLSSMQTPCRLDIRDASFALRDLGPVSMLQIRSDLVQITVDLVSRIEFLVFGFGKLWEYLPHASLNIDPERGLWKGEMLGPLIGLLLQAQDVDGVREALQWGLNAQLLSER